MIALDQLGEGRIAHFAFDLLALRVFAVDDKTERWATVGNYAVFAV